MRKQSKKLIISDNSIDLNEEHYHPDERDPTDRYYIDHDGIERTYATHRETNNTDPDLVDDYNVLLTPAYQEEISPYTVSINVSLYYKQMNKRANVATIQNIREIVLRLILYPDRAIEFKGDSKHASLVKRLIILEDYKVVKYKTGRGSRNGDKIRKSSIELNPEFNYKKWLTVPD